MITIFAENYRNIWLISDTHFSHANIIKYANRPFQDVEEMDRLMRRWWNQFIGPEDLIIHLGDIALMKKDQLAELISSLSGRKILVKGNHDRQNRHWYMSNGFDAADNALMIVDRGRHLDILCTHRPDQQIDIHHDLHFYGHVHDKGANDDFPTVSRNGACLCVERWLYTPVYYTDLVDMCMKSTIVAPLVS